MGVHKAARALVSSRGVRRNRLEVPKHGPAGRTPQAIQRLVRTGERRRLTKVCVYLERLDVVLRQLALPSSDLRVAEPAVAPFRLKDFETSARKDVFVALRRANIRPVVQSVKVRCRLLCLPYGDFRASQASCAKTDASGDVLAEVHEMATVAKPTDAPRRQRRALSASRADIEPHSAAHVRNLLCRLPSGRGSPRRGPVVVTQPKIPSLSAVYAGAHDICGNARLPERVGIYRLGATVGVVDRQVKPRPLRGSPCRVVVPPIRPVSGSKLHPYYIRPLRYEFRDVDPVIADLVEIFAPARRQKGPVGARSIQVKPVCAEPADGSHRTDDSLAGRDREPPAKTVRSGKRAFSLFIRPVVLAWMDNPPRTPPVVRIWRQTRHLGKRRTAGTNRRHKNCSA